MCRDAWCTRTVVDVLSDVLDSLNGGQPGPEALCASLTHLLPAQAAVYVRFAADSSPRTMATWPGHAPVCAALAEAAEQAPGPSPGLAHAAGTSEPTYCAGAAGPVVWTGSLAAALHRDGFGHLDLACISLARSGTEQRLVVLAWSKETTDRDMHLLDMLQRPLGALDTLLHQDDGAGGRDPTSRLPSRPVHEPSWSSRGGLTEREFEVLTMLADGLKARSIAARLQVSARTVHKHLGNIYRKLEAHDRLVAVHRAQAAGLIPTDGALQHD